MRKLNAILVVVSLAVAILGGLALTSQPARAYQLEWCGCCDDVPGTANDVCYETRVGTSGCIGTGVSRFCYGGPGKVRE